MHGHVFPCVPVMNLFRHNGSISILFMMLDHLKHTLIPLSAGLMLISCSSDEPDVSGCEMKFDISTVSRAAVTTAGNITENPFAVFGYMVPSKSADIPSARTIIYNNTPVTYVNSAWMTEETQYWYNDHVHSFVAIHPASAVNRSDANPQYSDALSFTYTLPSDITQTTDILAATHRRQYNDLRKYDEDGNLIGGEAAPVSLRFGHLMSQINIAPALNDNIMNDEEFIQFRKVELARFKTKATFNITPALLLTSDQTDDRVVDVTGQEAEGYFLIEFTDPKKIVNGQDNVCLFDNNDAIIMLPQTFAADSEAEFILSYTINNDPTIKQIVLPLNSQELESGRSYTYRFTIDRSGLLFGTMTIANWELLDVGDINAR